MTICLRSELLIALGTSESAISDADSALLNLVHPLAEAALAAYFQNDFQYAQRVEYLPIGGRVLERDNLEDIRKQGDHAVFTGGEAGHEALQLKYTPVVTTGLEVREDAGANAGQAADAFASDTVLTAGVDYWLDTDRTGVSYTGLLYRHGTWPSTARMVKVTYYGGFTAAELGNNIAGAIKLSALETIVAAYKTFKQSQGGSLGGKQSESIGKYSYSNSAAGTLTTSMAVAIPYSVIERMQPFRSYGRLFS